MTLQSFAAATQRLAFSSTLCASNRLYFAPMGFDLCDSQGIPTAAFFDIYKDLIDGGCGFGFLGNASVDSDSKYNGAGLKLTTPAHAEALKPLFEYAAKKQFPLGVQLQHYGPQGVPTASGLLSPSGFISPALAQKYPDVSLITMSDEQIQQCIAQFTYSAVLAKQAGAKLIQLQASNGYLISSFLSPRTNHRTDRWGGDALARGQFLLAIVKSIKAAVGSDVVLTVRLGVDDGFSEQGQKPHLLGDVAYALEQAGVASIACSVGVSETFRDFFKNPQRALEMTRLASRHLKQFVSIPVGFTGSVMSVAQAEQIIGSGDADFIGFARAVLADNQLVKKELSGQHEHVNRCLGDALCFRDKKEPQAGRVYCCVNPNYRRPESLQHYYKEN